MAKFAFTTTGLTQDERVQQAAKCVELLRPHQNQFNEWEASFFDDMDTLVGFTRTDFTQKQLNALKTMVEKYAL